MILKAREVRLRPEDRAVLEARCRAATTPQRDVRRARIRLLAAEGASTRSISRTVGVEEAVVSTWRNRFADEGLDGLKDRQRSGKPKTYTAETDRRILAVLDEPVPEGYARWTAPLIAERLGDVVGLYMAPPENAMVICVDEKPSIQALERAQGYLKLPGGRTLTGRSHDYKRNGTSTLFAAFEVATGKVTAGHKNRRRRVEFLSFMNELVAAYPGKTLHVVLDNLSTHKPKNDRWLKRHPNVRFHFTPTRASWLNQVEIWFSILESQSLAGASFTSVKQLREHIDAFIESYNQSATPFVWTKSKVAQRPFKGRRLSDL